ncbi:hypothetical protein DPMN_005212 [Dreissena polymorpha]|uniref:Uncharacterized protein n=1 Tax=Dreissena polymorpha TaxID=45954 RepID=A0A9D4MP85_DREPO|nr:hypothetical protein DPMN_005212 [Dreissena polymorpha]
MLAQSLRLFNYFKLSLSPMLCEYVTLGGFSVTHLCLASRKKALANSVDPDEMPHDAASSQGQRCLLKEISVKDLLNIEINKPDIPNFGNKLIQFRRMGESTRHKWVKTVDLHLVSLGDSGDSIVLRSIYSLRSLVPTCLLEHEYVYTGSVVGHVMNNM